MKKIKKEGQFDSPFFKKKYIDGNYNHHNGKQPSSF